MPEVSIVMGSDSDLKVMRKAADVLAEFGVPFEMKIISAHREPDIFFSYASEAKDRGIRIIIAGAGMAAHLPGMCAALFPLPVIGVPLRGGLCDGTDSLFSILQMPPGIPVATVAMDGAKNAGLLAVRMLAIGNEELLEKLTAYAQNMKNEVAAKDAKLQQVGYENYTK